MQDKRSSNLELLRIIAVLLITFNHIGGLGGGTLSENSLVCNQYISLFFEMGGKIGTNVFVITGCWFLSEGDFKLYRVIRIWLQTLAYGIGLNVIDVFLLGIEIQPLSFARSFFPILASRYWYPRAYMLMLLLIPLLRFLFCKISVKKQLSVLVFGFMTLSAVPFFSIYGKIFGENRIVSVCISVFTNEVVWFCYLFLLTFYIRRNRIRVTGRFSSPGWLLVFLVTYFLMFLLCFGMFTGKEYFGIDKTLLCDYYYMPREMMSPLNIMASFSLFFCLLNVKMPGVGIINKIAAGSFSVYLFQCHNASIDYIWKNVLDFREAASQPLLSFMIYSGYAVVVIFMAGLLLERLYQILLGDILKQLKGNLYLEGIEIRLNNLKYESLM